MNSNDEDARTNQWYRDMYAHHTRVLGCDHKWANERVVKLPSGHWFQMRRCRKCGKAEVRTKPFRIWPWSAWAWEPLP